MKFAPLMTMTCVIALAACSTDKPTGSTYVPPPTGIAPQALQAPAGPAYVAGGYDSNARDSMAAGDIAAAETSFGQAVDVNPFDPIALNNLAVAKTEAGDFHSALGLLERAARLAPQNTEIAANLARLRSWNENYAMQDGSTLGSVGDTGAISVKNLPPEPPQLWDTRTSAEK